MVILYQVDDNAEAPTKGSYGAYCATAAIYEDAELRMERKALRGIVESLSGVKWISSGL